MEAMAEINRNSKYKIALLVTFEEELAIMKLFSVNGWAFIRVSEDVMVKRDDKNEAYNLPNTPCCLQPSTGYPTEITMSNQSSDITLVTQNINNQVQKDPVEEKGTIYTNCDKLEFPNDMSVVVHENDSRITTVSKPHGEEIGVNYLENSYFQIPPHIIERFAGNTEILSKTKSLLVRLSSNLKGLNTSSPSNTGIEQLNIDISEWKEATEPSIVDLESKFEEGNQRKKITKKRSTKVKYADKTNNLMTEKAMEKTQNQKEGIGNHKTDKQTEEKHVADEKNTTEQKIASEKRDIPNTTKTRAQLYKDGDAVRNEVDKHIDVNSLIIVKNDEIVCCMCRTNYKSEDSFKSHASQCLADLFNTRGCNVYKCTGCRAFFRQAFTLLRHRRSEVCVPGQERKDENFLTCDTCGKTYPTRRTTEYIHHIQAHNNERPFGCEVCGKDFVRWTSLRNHKRIHTGEKPYTCRYCPLTFVSGAGQRNHEMVRHADLPRKYVCDKCGASFKIRSRLSCHIKAVHDKTDIYSCDLCEKTFTRKGSLTDHKRTHGNIKDKTCDICGKGFIRQSDLTEHMKRHRNERSFFCDECGKGFYKKINLAEHKRSHSGVKPFSCNICKYKCAYYSNAVKHCRARHPEVQKLKDAIVRKAPPIT